MALKQDNRTLFLKTALGENVLVLTSFRGTEEMSRLFVFHLEMTSDNNAIQAKDIVGTNVTFGVKLTDGTPRYFNGFVSRFAAGDEDEKGRRNYRAEVVPWLWFLTRTTDCRIFQDKKIPDIITQIFGDLGFSDYELQIKGTHPKHVYCVQYRETDFNFVSRLAEEEGIFFFFKHQDGKHTLVLSDDKGAYTDCAEKEVDYPGVTGSHRKQGQLTRWEHQYEFRTGKYAQTDYNFETPSTNLMTNEPSVIKIPGMDKYEFYDYPGGYPTTSDGRPLTRVRMEEEEAGHDVVQGSSTCPTFSPGYKFKVRSHRSSSEEGKTLVLTSVEHSASEAMPYETGRGGREEEEGYRNTFRCIPEATTFRPARITRKPFVQGPQTAVVVGPGGEEIYPDKYGRVKVQFFWDREGKKDDKSSCWVRVSQNWAGQSWGGMFIPHVGQEVIVDFLEGDPDLPIITGRVYNAEQTVPLELPANKTKCIIRDYGDNQMIWEGKPDEQFIHIQQECGHELLMNGMKGRESIQLRDMYGNEIFMDSVGGTMRLTSPTHDSTIILGNSIFTSVSSNNSSFTKGNTLNVHAGLKHDVYLGQRSQTDGGNYFETMVGLKTTCVVGQEVNFRVGFTLNLQYAKEVTENKFDYVQHAVGPMKLDSEDQVGIVGGAGDAAKARFAKDGIVLSYNEQPGAPKRGAVSAAGWAAAAVAAYAMGSQIGQGIAIGQSKAELDTDTTSRAEIWTNSSMGQANGYTVAGLGFATTVAGMLTGKNKSETSDWSDGESEAKISMAADGIVMYADACRQQIQVKKGKGITLDSRNEITLFADTAISLKALTKKITVTGLAAEFGSTKIKQKNLLVD